MDKAFWVHHCHMSVYLLFDTEYVTNNDKTKMNIIFILPIFCHIQHPL